ncbi:ArsR/SmtB family transcription factor [Actinoplanes couchii]|uniref:HTH arsR-type domain-containing protein n=1 Tax=Actinoplanes couchii TaxID=403638 RepID=A0ABQ3XJN3_9ACTN|nr:helix-turn-helix domain-containing protein [Actinoplanes couchii]MDR6324205.1 DNA-binding transcriptional ArsR family regulator [Actinoplanes couchii]GID58709.1 hypothetical protein Aco03nite_071130 [Actinoplanes couchii]
MALEEAPKALLRSLAHPVRIQIMSLLTGASLTAADVAREMDLTHANASYHLRNLLSAGLIVVDGEEKIRGGIAKRYRYRPVKERSSGSRSDDERRAQFAVIAQELVRRSSQASFASRGHLYADGDFWIDPEVWLAIRDRIIEAVSDLHQAAQPPHTPGTVRTSTSVALFQHRAVSE